MKKNKKIQDWLLSSNGKVLAFYGMFFAFASYFCMYAFRKPFSVGIFRGDVFIPLIGVINYKIFLIISQVFGYMLSKFVGIKFVSEVGGNKRLFFIILMILSAEIALLLFAITSSPYNSIFLFLNGIPLGMIWGLVFAYLEGRFLSDLLGAGLSASFIISSGVVKSVGRYLISLGVTEFWMPFTTGLIFLPFILFFVYMLDQLPPPSELEEKVRSKRTPMGARKRAEVFFKLAPGLIALTFLYMILTSLRDFRDNFAREIWDSLGYAGSPEIFTLSEIPIAVGVLVLLGGIAFIKDNRRSFDIIYMIMIFGTMLIGLSTLAFKAGIITAAPWMILVGTGLYLAYVPFGCMLFDNLLAVLGIVGTAGFMIYIADAFGYLGSVGLMIYKNFARPDIPWTYFFINLCYITSFVCMTLFIASYFYFRRVGKESDQQSYSDYHDRQIETVPI